MADETVEDIFGPDPREWPKPIKLTMVAASLLVALQNVQFSEGDQKTARDDLIASMLEMCPELEQVAAGINQAVETEIKRREEEE